MMAGAPEAPAPQNFRQGGAVQKFQTGGAATSIMSLLDNDFDFGTEVKTQYESLLPIFQGIVGEEDRAQQAEREEFDRARALLSVARGGYVWRRVTHVLEGLLRLSLVRRLGHRWKIAALGAQAQDRRDAIRAQDQQLRLGALQASIGQPVLNKPLI